MKTTKVNKRLIALLLCLSILLCLMPASAIATDLVADETASIVGTEVVSLREENIKHFDMGDGTYQAVAYSHPVHELDSEGKWQDIDFSMNLTQTRGVRGYTNSAGTTLAAKYTENQPLVTMTGNGTSIAMTLVPDDSLSASTRAAKSSATVAAKLTETQTQLITFSDAQAASFSNTLYYESVMPGVDLEYIVDPWTVKENIILNQPASEYTYRFKLELDGLYPLLREDGSVLIYSSETDEAKYEVPAPYMYDAIGEMSLDVSYTLTGSNGVYYLAIAADEKWINADEREFPVVIDPSFEEYQGVNMDTYINQDTPNEARGGYKFFFVGENEVAYIYTPTPTLPVLATLDSAYLLLYYFYKDFVTTGYVNFSAHLVTDFYWAEESLKWTDVVGADYETYDNYRFGLSSDTLCTASTFGAAGATSSSPKSVSVDIKDAIEVWRADDSDNKGIGLRYVTSSPNKSVMFRSTEGYAAYRPRLFYSYTLSYSPENLKEVNLILQYDHAYINRYKNPEEGIEAEVIVQERIAQEAAKLQKFFLEEFDIMVNYSTAKLFDSYGDECPNNNTTICYCEGKICTNADSDDNHHTNINQILYNTFDSDGLTENSVLMSYIGRNICYIGAQQTCSQPPLGYGLSFEAERVMGIANHLGVGSETVTAIHEMGHMFGVEDHYSHTAENSENDNCLYGKLGYQGNNPDAITLCDDCRNTIMRNRDRYDD